MKWAAIFLLLALGAMPAWSEDAPTHVITVAGEAELQLPPDYADLELGVVTQGKTVAAATAENAARMTAVLAAVRTLGIADKDLHTSTFRLQPRYQPLAANRYEDEASRVIEGYAVSNLVTVRVRDLKIVARVIDQAAAAGANSTGSLTFGIDNVPARFDDARRAAVADARHKAEVLADAAHLKLGPALAITDNNASMRANGEGRDVETVVVTGSRVPTPVAPGLVHVVATISVQFAVE